MNCCIYCQNVHFTFSNKIYNQNEGVAIGSPLDPALENVIMVELETALIGNSVATYIFGDALLLAESVL